jgi:phage tail tape-measure protein
MKKIKQTVNCDWHKAIVKKWIANNPEAIERASSEYKTELAKALKALLEAIEAAIKKIFGVNYFARFAKDFENALNAIANTVSEAAETADKVVQTVRKVNKAIDTFHRIRRGTPWLRF